MKRTSPQRGVIRPMTAVALVGPLALFAVLYLTVVRPQRLLTQAALARVNALRSEIQRDRSASRAMATTAANDAKSLFEQRTAKNDPTPDVIRVLGAAAADPSTGRLRNLSVAADSSITGEPHPRLMLFQVGLSYTPIVVTFEARAEEISRFFWNLRRLPTTYELRSLDLERAANSQLMRAKIVLFVFRHAGPSGSRQAGPPIGRASDSRVAGASPAAGPLKPQSSEPRVAMATERLPSDPVVQGVLLATYRRVAFMDGRVVQPGDRIGSLVVRAIEPDGVVVVPPTGPPRRLPVRRANVQVTRR